MYTLNFQIGNQFIRGVSGGQRKRTSIAMEMIVSPAILFLDEPTTGLDATTALSVIRLLHKYVNFNPLVYVASCSLSYSLSKEGRIIVMSIHQPRYSIFRLFDHLTLLSRGEIVYHGKSKGALLYFSGVLSKYWYMYKLHILDARVTICMFIIDRNGL